MSEYIRRKDAIRSVLRNDGEATVARIQELPTIDLDRLQKEVVSIIVSHCDDHVGMCAECPICPGIAEAFDRAKRGAVQTRLEWRKDGEDV